LPHAPTQPAHFVSITGTTFPPAHQDVIARLKSVKRHLLPLAIAAACCTSRHSRRQGDNLAPRPALSMIFKRPTHGVHQREGKAQALRPTPGS
jgi:hypothetical protein